MTPIITIARDDTNKVHCQSTISPINTIKTMAKVLAMMTEALQEPPPISSDN